MIGKLLLACVLVMAVLDPATPMFGSTISRGMLSQNKLALTFDDGPSMYTEDILRVLSEHNVKTTFFFIGRNALEHQDIVNLTVAEGHEIGVHSFSHPVMVFRSRKFVDNEIIKTKQILEKHTDVKYFRPPYGLRDWTTMKSAENAGLKTVMWTYMVPDYREISTERIVHMVKPKLRNGAIIVLHDGGGNRSRTVHALPYIIQEAKSRGFELVTLSELLS